MEGVFEKEDEGPCSLGANHLMGRRHTERHKELRYQAGRWEHQESIEEREEKATGRSLEEALSQDGEWGHSRCGAGTITAPSPPHLRESGLCQALHIHCLLLGPSQGTL